MKKYSIGFLNGIAVCYGSEKQVDRYMSRYAHYHDTSIMSDCDEETLEDWLLIYGEMERL